MTRQDWTYTKTLEHAAVCALCDRPVDPSIPTFALVNMTTDGSHPWVRTLAGPVRHYGCHQAHPDTRHIEPLPHVDTRDMPSTPELSGRLRMRRRPDDKPRYVDKCGSIADLRFMCEFFFWNRC